MATFRVHEDLEKENRLHAPAGGKKATVPLGTMNSVVALAGKNQVLQGGPLQQQQQQRTMFSVLNNVQPANVTNAEKAVKDAKGKHQQRAAGPVLLPKVGKGDENVLESKLSVQAKAIQKSTAVTSEVVLQAFQVYDESKENLTHLSAAKREEPHHEKRCPLQEIKNVDLLETPMSVSESFSPMSVDKSAIIAVDDGPIPRNDRERFYEVEEYQRDILSYLKEAEQRNRPKPGYMLKQTDITYSMRTVLVDWLVEVSEEYKLQGETLVLAVSYIDRFLSFMSVVRAKLQLVGTAALFIAAKYEEIYPPDVGEFVYITDDTYTKTQVLRMEQLILKVLSFDLTVPTPLVFTNIYCVINDLPDKVKYLTMYMCELSLLEADPYLAYVQSEIAAGALALAHRALELPMWSKMLESSIGYQLTSLKRIILDLSKTHAEASTMQQQAIQEKYKSKTFKEVAFLPATELTEEAFDRICDSLSNSSSCFSSSSTALPRHLIGVSSSEQGKELARDQKTGNLVFV